MLLPNKFYPNDIFEDFLKSKTVNNMKCDIYTKDNIYHIEMEIPGYNKEDIKIEVDNGYLTVTAEREENNNDKSNKNYVHKERTYGKISRSFNFGDIDSSSIKAKFEHGILIITIPKNEKLDTKKYINID